jgi:hypothetical protein
LDKALFIQTAFGFFKLRIHLLKGNIFGLTFFSAFVSFKNPNILKKVNPNIVHLGGKLTQKIGGYSSMKISPI